MQRKGDNWSTEQVLFDALDKEFSFVSDLAASSSNAKLKTYFDEYDNSLSKDWTRFEGYKWLNPPYSTGSIEPFMAKVAAEAKRGAKIVTLTRMDSSTEWYKRYIHNVARQIRLLEHRVKFIGAESAYNFPCVVCVFDKTNVRKSEFVTWSWRS